MEEKEEILNVLMEVIGEEGCGVSCEEAEVFKDEVKYGSVFEQRNQRGHRSIP
jgi:hypothetical protein